MSVTLEQQYRDAVTLRKLVGKHWFCFQLTECDKQTLAYRYEQRRRIFTWCYDTFGSPYGVIDPASFMTYGKWFYAEAMMSNCDDFLFFKNEDDVSLFLLKFNNEVISSNL